MKSTVIGKLGLQPAAVGRPEEIKGEDVKAIRYKFRQTQPEFALTIGVSLATLQSWEEGRHHPDGPARALLRVAAKNPKIVARTLGRG